MDCFTTEQVRRVRRVPFYEPAIEDILGADSRSLVPQRANARGPQRQPPGPTKGYLSAEDLGILSCPSLPARIGRLHSDGPGGG
jgi:hypothetical protein